jgi:uncharacterized protein
VGRNVRKNKKAAKAVTHNDGLVSMHTSLGQKSNDVFYAHRPRLSDAQLMNMYDSSWIVKKFVNKTAEDMLKKQREVSGGIPADKVVKLFDIEEDLELKQVKFDALTWASLLGDVLVVAITDINDNLINTKYNPETESIIRFLVFDKTQYTPSSELDEDIKSKNFGKPEYYTVTNSKIKNQSSGLKFHNSRCHRIKLGKHKLSDICNYGTSDIQSSYDVIKLYDKTILTASDTIEEANVDILSMEGLNDQIDAGQEGKVIEYAQVASRSKSSTGFLLIDSKTQYSQKTASFGGLSDIITKAETAVCASLDRPITNFFSYSAAGFSSGEEDNNNYYDSINALQENRLRPLQNFIDKFIFKEVLTEDEIRTLKFSYPTLDSTKATDDATIFASFVTGMVSLVNESLITEENALNELVARKALITVTDDDIKKIVRLNGGNDVTENTTSKPQENETSAQNQSDETEQAD